MPRHGFRLRTPRRMPVALLVLVLVGSVVVATGALLGRAVDLVAAPTVAAHTVDEPDPVPSGSTGATPSPPDAIAGVPPPGWPLPESLVHAPGLGDLQRNPLHDVVIPDMSGCPEPAEVSTAEELETAARAELDCIQEAWRPVLAASGYDDHIIPVYFYGESVTSPCGTGLYATTVGECNTWGAPEASVT